jgi:glutamyl-tRNA synthetase
MIQARFAPSPTGYLHIVEGELRKLAEVRGVKAELLINASRAALTRQTVGPSAFAIFVCIGRECVIQRLRRI